MKSKNKINKAIECLIINDLHKKLLIEHSYLVKKISELSNSEKNIYNIADDAFKGQNFGSLIAKFTWKELLGFWKKLKKQGNKY